MTRVYDLHGDHRRTTPEDPDDVFYAAAVHAASREPVFVVSSRGHAALVERIRAAGIDAFEDEVLDEYDTAIIVSGDVQEWPELRRSIA